MMAQPSYKKYVLLVLAIGCLLQLLLAIVYWKLIEPYRTWQQLRVVEVTSFPLRIRLPLVDGYIANTVAKQTKPLVLVMGDSEPYGPYVEDHLTFSYLLAQHLPNYAVFNISIKGAQLADIDKLIDSLERYNVHPEFIIFDVNFAHFRSPGNMLDDQEVLPQTSIPMWLAIASVTLPNVRSVYQFRNQWPDLRPETFNYLPLPRDSIPRDQSPVFEESFKHVLSRLKPVSKNIVAYMAPFAIESFRYYGFDDIAFQRIAASYIGICQDLGMDCLDLSGALPIDNFIDIIHLNRQGHAFMAQRLEQEITK
jgi:hypothetical protein